MPFQIRLEISRCPRAHCHAERSGKDLHERSSPRSRSIPTLTELTRPENDRSDPHRLANPPAVSPPSIVNTWPVATPHRPTPDTQTAPQSPPAWRAAPAESSGSLRPASHRNIPPAASASAHIPEPPRTPAPAAPVPAPSTASAQSLPPWSRCSPRNTDIPSPHWSTPSARITPPPALPEKLSHMCRAAVCAT